MHSAEPAAFAPGDSEDAPDPQTHSGADYRINLLVSALRRHAAPCVLALDEVERLQSPEAVATLNALLRRAPDNLHVGMAYRERPPGLDVAMLELEGRASTVTVDDLRFSTPDIPRFFSRRLPRRELNSLSARSAGWPIALRIYSNADRKGAWDPRRGRRRRSRRRLDRDPAVARRVRGRPRIRARHRAAGPDRTRPDRGGHRCASRRPAPGVDGGPRGAVLHDGRPRVGDAAAPATARLLRKAALQGDPATVPRPAPRHRRGAGQARTHGRGAAPRGRGRGYGPVRATRRAHRGRDAVAPGRHRGVAHDRPPAQRGRAGALSQARAAAVHGPDILRRPRRGQAHLPGHGGAHGPTSRATAKAATTRPCSSTTCW